MARPKLEDRSTVRKKTSLTIRPAVLAEAEDRARREGVSVSRLVEVALERHLRGTVLQ